MPRPTVPPPQSFFETDRPAWGRERLAVKLGPLAFELSGLDDDQLRRLLPRYGPYTIDDARDAPLLAEIDVVRHDADYFIDPPEGKELTRVHLAFDDDGVRFLSYRAVGRFDPESGEGDLVLSRGTWEPVERAIENYVRMMVAWMAAMRGGALVHAASAVLDGQGYLFFGESGAGKSTLSAVNRRARVVSDDLSLVLPAGGRPHLIGSPFRGTYEEGEPVHGAYPLAAGFRLIQAPAAAVKNVPRAVAFSGLVGNLPFVAEAFPQRPDLFASVQRTFDAVPLAHLEFAKDESYWDAIAAAGLAAR